VTALGGDLRCALRVEQGVVDVVDLDLDVVRLAPLLDVRPVEPPVVVGNEVRPGHDPQLSRELLVRKPERAVHTKGLVRQPSVHADGEGCRRSSPEQVAPGQCGSRTCDLVGCICHVYLLSGHSIL
jgi:hypothetical protein